MSHSRFDPQKHHRHSIRLPDYDYAQPGAYFVTIVTWHRECLFGEVVGGVMRLNKFGLVAQQQWEKLPKRFPNIDLGAFQIMPDHTHGIIVIVAGRGTAENPNDPDGESSRRALTREGTAENPNDPDGDSSRRALIREGTAGNPHDPDGESSRRALTREGTAENPNDPDGDSSRRALTREGFQKPVKGSIPTIVRSYKSAVSYRINLMRGTQNVPIWQRNYYEHVIRNQRDLQNKTDYIEANPKSWGEDEKNPWNLEP